MIKYIQRLIVFSTILFFIPVSAYAQIFGQNKVQYKDLKWKRFETPHFHIFFYDGGKYLAEFGAEVMEEELNKLQDEFDYTIKKKIPVLLYNAHNDFQQTNVINQFLTEGIGGVTELFKNRIFLPYEGSYSQFRHVLHHELIHAFVNDMIYGGSIQNLISSGIQLRLPLWFAEGLAEYLSVGWDTRADMIVRDGTIHDYLQTYMSPYPQGQSIFRYIEDKYGREKVVDVVRRVNITKSLDRGFKSSLGMEFEKLIDEWDLAMKRKYWPDISDRLNPEEFSTRMTDHIKLRNSMNLSPALSPNGNEIAYMTNVNGYADIYLMSAIDGKIIKKLVGGQKSAALEELHWLSPGISWSPDGKNLALSVKAGDQDALTIINIRKRDFTQFKFDLDGVFDAAWSPDGKEIAFQGTLHGAADIYAYNVENGNLRQITKDYFSDGSPNWSPDGSKILFVSDRKNNVEEYIDNDNNNAGGSTTYSGYSNGGGIVLGSVDDGVQNNINGQSSDIYPINSMYAHDYQGTDIYMMNADGSNIERLTFDPYDDGSPVWGPDGKQFLYISEASGIANVYIYNLETRDSYPITNTLTGVYQLSLSPDGRKLVLSAYNNNGWDIFMLKNPLEKESLAENMKKTVFFTQLAEKEEQDKPFLANMDDTEFEIEEKQDLSQYVFDDDIRNVLDGDIELKETIGDDISNYKSANGEFNINDYKITFSPDIVYGNYAYDTFFGVQGSSIFQFSDMLGNHVIQLATDLFFDLRNSSYQLSYIYLPRRTNYAIGMYNQANFFTQLVSDGNFTELVGIRLRNFGLNFSASRPFNKFSRVDFSVAIQQVKQDFLSPFYTEFNRSITAYRSSLNISRDTSQWYIVGPIDGARSNLFLSYNPPIGSPNNRLEFFTAIGDVRKYFRLSRDVSFALRASAGLSEGDTPETFFLGGVPNWINRKFSGGRIRSDFDDVFFSHWIGPLHGSDYYELIGNRFSIINAELRFPFIQALLLGWPLPLYMQNLSGLLFADVGAAWNNSDFNATEKVQGFSGSTSVFKDMRSGFGTGMNIGLLGFYARFAVAWKYDLDGTGKPKYYLSLAGDW